MFIMVSLDDEFKKKWTFNLNHLVAMCAVESDRTHVLLTKGEFHVNESLMRTSTRIQSQLAQLHNPQGFQKPLS